MDYDILCAELSKPEYAGLTDEEIVERLNAPGELTYRPVPISKLAELAYALGLPVRLRAAIRTPGTPVEIVAVCESLLDLLKAPFDAVDFYAADGTPDPATEAMLGALIEAGLLTEAEADALRALAVVQQPSTAERILGRAATADDIARARAWEAAQQAEQERRMAYNELRMRLNHWYGTALARLNAMDAAGNPVPAWDDVLSW